MWVSCDYYPKTDTYIDQCVCVWGGGVRWGTKNECHKDWKESWIVSTICIDYSALSNQINWEDSCFSWSRNHLTLSSYMNIFHSICSIWHELPLSCFHLVRGWITSVWTIRIFMHCVNIFSDGVAMNSISNEQYRDKQRWHLWTVPGV